MATEPTQAQELRFFAPGVPKTKGSTKSFMRPGMKFPITTGANPKTKAWQGVVALAAQEAGARMLDGPVELRIIFFFPRPKKHYRTGKHSSVLRDDAPDAVTSHALGDIDKLERAILDALTGTCFKDDAQVSLVGPHAKRFTPKDDSHGAGAKILVRVDDGRDPW